MNALHKNFVNAVPQCIHTSTYVQYIPTSLYSTYLHRKLPIHTNITHAHRRHALELASLNR